MARYLLILLAATIAACTYSSSSDPGKAALYPETRSAEVAVFAVSQLDVHAPVAGAQHKLAAFARHASVPHGVRGRVRDFEVLYHAPNRDPRVARPYLPASIPDRLMIMFKDDVFIEETIPQQFSGTAASRAVEVAQLRVRGQNLLLVTSGSELARPMWVALFSDSGKLLYRAATPHGRYRLVEHADGISMLDEGGHGKRIKLL